ncbi:MAG: hypothetical protein JO122_09115 [Acetobacteraceae bacterium]|nr:hypothetical protein [Acetobacteraceae bacterium]
MANVVHTSHAKRLANPPPGSLQSAAHPAIQSARPALLRWLAEWRVENVSPGSVTVGTPIHSASHVVSPPGAERKQVAFGINRYFTRAS